MELKQKIIQAVQTAPDENKLGEYLAKIAKVLNPPKYENKLLTLHDAFKKSLEAFDQNEFRVELEHPRFLSFTQDFFLTPGLHIIAAPSGHGKTFWAMEWAKQAAKTGHNVLMLSLEMSPTDLGSRSIAENSEIPLKSIMRKQISDTQRLVLNGLVEQDRFDWMKKIHIDTPGDYDWAKIEPRLNDLMMRIKPRLIIVDYAQMIHDSQERDIRQSKILGEIARDLKLFAEHTQSAVLLLSQMNREALREIKPSKWEEIGFVPLSNEHVKESGAIVEAADSVQLICVPARFHNCPYAFQNHFQIVVDKSRRLGQLGIYRIGFDGENMKWTSP